MFRDKLSSPVQFFPALSTNNIQPDKKCVKIGVHPLSNLPLQVSLYFNLIFFPVWILAFACMIPLKFWSLSRLYQFILVLALITIIIIECIRLYIGYKGNLKEKISELAGFWLITVLLQTPLQTFMLFSSGLKPSILESIIQTIMCIFLLLQLFFGAIALRNSANYSVLSFHLANNLSQDPQGIENIN